jgi:hypothetical protein
LWTQPSTRRWPSWPRSSTAHGHGAARPADAAVLAGAGRRGGCRTTCTWSTPLAGRHQGALQPVYMRCWKTSTTWTGSTKTSWPVAPAAGHGLWKGGDQAMIDGVVVNGSGSWWAGWPAWCAGADGLYLPLRAGDDSGRVRADDLVRLARLLQSSNKEKNKMGLLSLAIWTPIAFWRSAAGGGRDEHSRAVRWMALIGALSSACW